MPINSTRNRFYLALALVYFLSSTACTQGGKLQKAAENCLHFNIDRDSGIQACQDAIRLTSASDKNKLSELYRNLGRRLYAFRKLNEALDAYNKAIAIDPNYESAYYDSAGILNELGKSTEVVKVLRSAIQINPNNGDTHYNLALMYESLKRMTEARSSYAQAIAIWDSLIAKDGNYLFNNTPTKIIYDKAKSKLGLLPIKTTVQDPELARGDDDCANLYGDAGVQACQKAIGLTPSSDKKNLNKYQYNLGWKLVGLGKQAEALDAFNKAVDSDPKDESAQYIIGETLIHLGKHEEAIKVLKKILTINPANARAYYQSGMAFIYLGKPIQAFEFFEKAIENEPSPAREYYYLGVKLFQLGKLTEALQAFNKSISMDPKNEDAQIFMGVALLNLGKLTESLEAFRRATQINPRSGIALYNLAITYEQLKRTAEARTAYTQAIAITDSFIVDDASYLANHLQEKTFYDQVKSKLTQ